MISGNNLHFNRSTSFSVFIFTFSQREMLQSCVYMYRDGLYVVLIILQPFLFLNSYILLISLAYRYRFMRGKTPLQKRTEMNSFQASYLLDFPRN